MLVALFVVIEKRWCKGYSWDPGKWHKSAADLEHWEAERGWEVKRTKARTRQEHIVKFSSASPAYTELWREQAERQSIHRPCWLHPRWQKEKGHKLEEGAQWRWRTGWGRQKCPIFVLDMVRATAVKWCCRERRSTPRGWMHIIRNL